MIILGDLTLAYIWRKIKKGLGLRPKNGKGEAKGIITL
jgi:hypothetical protein